MFQRLNYALKKDLSSFHFYSEIKKFRFLIQYHEFTKKVCKNLLQNYLCFDAGLWEKYGDFEDGLKMAEVDELEWPRLLTQGRGCSHQMTSELSIIYPDVTRGTDPS